MLKTFLSVVGLALLCSCGGGGFERSVRSPILETANRPFGTWIVNATEKTFEDQTVKIEAVFRFEEGKATNITFCGVRVNGKTTTAEAVASAPASYTNTEIEIKGSATKSEKVTFQDKRGVSHEFECPAMMPPVKFKWSKVNNRLKIEANGNSNLLERAKD